MDANSTNSAPSDGSIGSLPVVLDADNAPSHPATPPRAYDPYDLLDDREKKLLVAALRNHRSLRGALKVAGIAQSQHTKWLREDRFYREAIRMYEEDMGDLINFEVYDAALNGIRKPVIYQGTITDWYREKSPQLLWRVAQAIGRQEFRDSKKGQKYQVNIGTVDNRQMFLEKLQLAKSKLQANEDVVEQLPPPEEASDTNDRSNT